MFDKDRGLDPFARRCIAAGALLMLAGVILGAFGAHLLEARLAPKQLASYQTGVLYQLLHSIGLVVVGVVAQVTGTTTRLRWSGRDAVRDCVLLGLDLPDDGRRAAQPRHGRARGRAVIHGGVGACWPGTHSGPGLT